MKLKISLLLIFLDLFAIFFSILLAVSVRKYIGTIYPSLPVIDYSYLEFLEIYTTIVVIYIFFNIYSKRYDFWQETKLIIKANLYSFILIFAGLALGKNGEFYSRSTLILIIFFVSILVPALKALVKPMLFSLGIWKKKAKVISNDKEFKHEIFNNPYLGYIKSLDEKYETLFIDSNGLSKEKLNTIIESNIRKSREIIFTPLLSEYDYSKNTIYNIFNSRINVFSIENFLFSRVKKLTKMIFDYFIIVALFPIWFPLLCVIALLIKANDYKGSAFFKQRRIGLNGKEFICYKFRTMYEDQSFMFKWLEDNPKEKEYYRIYHKYINDPRVTSIGNILRKTSLDELPQLINVLKGEMSLIGPRPYMSSEKDKIGEKSYLLLSVKPGVTGLWQVSGRSEIDFRNRVEMDIWYMKNWSLWLDFVILCKTFSTILRRKGAY